MVAVNSFLLPAGFQTAKCQNFFAAPLAANDARAKLGLLSAKTLNKVPCFPRATLVLLHGGFTFFLP
jgi:hypothetical protein